MTSGSLEFPRSSIDTAGVESPTSEAFEIDAESYHAPTDKSDHKEWHQRFHPNGFNPMHAVPRTTIKVPKREGTLLGTDPTCLPPITAGRQRTLVLCFDGTGDSFDDDISNIAKIFGMLKKDDMHEQMCYYQSGIGTVLNHRVTLPVLRSLHKAVDQAVASNLAMHIKEGYEFLMNNYVAGDKVCLFGFSRGAYTARSLAGMLHKVGLLPKGNKQQIPFAWRMFKDISNDGWELSRQFKDSFCVDVNVDFLGVFDTVSSVGVLYGRTMPFAASNYGVCYFRHAMALDERRARFKVNHWGKVEQLNDPGVGRKKKREARIGHENTWTEPDDVCTDVKEVWFAGGHCDVGGGNVANDEKYIAANIPLRWMIRETFRCKTGILWDLASLRKLGLQAENLYPEVKIPTPSVSSRPGTPVSEQSVKSGREPIKHEKVYNEDDPELRDANAQLFDQLATSKIWWILELLPTKGKKQIEEDLWKECFFINRGRGRIVPKLKKGMAFHRSVKLRLEKGDYKTRAIYNCDPTWVD